MNMESMNSLFGIIGIGCGLYCLYSYYMMRTKGDINSSILLPKGTEVYTCKDKAGFIKETSNPLLILSIFAIIYGGLELFNAFVQPVGFLLVISMVTFFIVVMWFGFVTAKIRKKYF